MKSSRFDATSTPWTDFFSSADGRCNWKMVLLDVVLDTNETVVILIFINKQIDLNHFLQFRSFYVLFF